MRIRKILCPVDFSEASGDAARYARDLAEHYGAQVVVIHVIYDIQADTGWYSLSVDTVELYRDMERAAREEFERFKKQYFEGFQDVQYVQLRGTPDEEIVNWAAHNGADLIVMGTHGRKGLDRVLFGSTASKVVRYAPCPVMTVRAPSGS
ncbi:MAG: universal stress protein [Nitrospirota bacterium]|jgi:nucleotide-binding universal stress UspA family protein